MNSKSKTENHQGKKRNDSNYFFPTNFTLPAVDDALNFVIIAVGQVRQRPVRFRNINRNINFVETKRIFIRFFFVKHRHHAASTIVAVSPRTSSSLNFGILSRKVREHNKNKNKYYENVAQNRFSFSFFSVSFISSHHIETASKFGCGLPRHKFEIAHCWQIAKTNRKRKKIQLSFNHNTQNEDFSLPLCCARC